LIRRLAQYNNLAKLELEGAILTREGAILGDQKKELPDLRGKPFFQSPRFPHSVFLSLDATTVLPWPEPRVDRKASTDFEAFKIPQLLIKQSFSARLGRFRAAIVRSSDPVWGVVCTQAFLSIRDFASDARHIRAAALVFNSRFATYYLALTSSRLGHYRTEPLAEELVTVPLPPECPDITSVASFEEIDELTRKAFLLTPADWAIIEDLLDVTLPDALRKAPGPGRKPTTRVARRGRDEPELSAYAQTLARVLKSAFGRDKAVAATIYQEPDATRLPVRMVTIHLDWIGRDPLTIEPIAADGLLDRLASFHRDVLAKRARSATGEGLGFQRVAFFFHAHRADHGRVPNLTIIKPDEYRYWTRSQAMRDADELAAAIMQAAGGKGPGR
jgi:hypothetical protein